MANEQADGRDARLAEDDAEAVARRNGLDLSPARLKVVAEGLGRFVSGMALIDEIDLRDRTPPVRTFWDDETP